MSKADLNCNLRRYHTNTLFPIQTCLWTDFHSPQPVTRNGLNHHNWHDDQPPHRLLQPCHDSRKLMKVIGKAKTKKHPMRIHAITIICYTLVHLGFPLKASLECHLANTKLFLDRQEMNPKIKKKKKCMDVVDHFVLRNYYVYRKLPPVWQWSYVLAGWVPKAGKNRSVGGPMAIPLADYLVKLRVGWKYLIFLGWATRVTTMVVDQIWLVSWRPVDVAFKVADVHQAFRTFFKLLSDLWWTETKSSLPNICPVTERFVVNWDERSQSPLQLEIPNVSPAGTAPCP